MMATNSALWNLSVVNLTNYIFLGLIHTFAFPEAHRKYTKTCILRAVPLIPNARSSLSEDKTHEKCAKTRIECKASRHAGVPKNENAEDKRGYMVVYTTAQTKPTDKNVDRKRSKSSTYSFPEPGWWRTYVSVNLQKKCRKSYRKYTTEEILAINWTLLKFYAWLN